MKKDNGLTLLEKIQQFEAERQEKEQQIREEAEKERTRLLTEIETNETAYNTKLAELSAQHTETQTNLREMLTTINRILGIAEEPVAPVTTGFVEATVPDRVDPNLWHELMKQLSCQPNTLPQYILAVSANVDENQDISNIAIEHAVMAHGYKTKSASFRTSISVALKGLVDEKLAKRTGRGMFRITAAGRKKVERMIADQPVTGTSEQPVQTNGSPLPSAFAAPLAAVATSNANLKEKDWVLYALLKKGKVARGDLPKVLPEVGYVPRSKDGSQIANALNVAVSKLKKDGLISANTIEGTNKVEYSLTKQGKNEAEEIGKKLLAA